MSTEDKLTREERVRLEAFAAVSVRHVSHPVPLEQHLGEADRLIAWLQQFNPPGSSKATPLEIRATSQPVQGETVVVETKR